MRRQISKLDDDTKKAELAHEADKVEDDFRKVDVKFGDVLLVLQNKIASARGFAADAGAPTQPALAPITIKVSAAPENCRADIELGFTIVGARSPLKAVSWAFDGLARQSQTEPIKHTFAVPGQYIVSATITYYDGTTDPALPLRITVLPSASQSQAQRILQRIRQADLAELAAALIIAVIAGMLDRYVDKPFGTVTDYCCAFLWGFGIDSAVRGFGATLARIKT